MSDLIVLGTDTDAGKTTFCVLWLAAFSDLYEYWKPVESGESDSERVAALVPGAVVRPPLKRFARPLAPPLAARLEQDAVPASSVIAHARPRPPNGRSLLIETFGNPFSPLNEQELQISLLRALGGTAVLVSSSALGAIGRTLSVLEALKTHGVHPAQVVLVGERDDYAAEQIRQHGGIPVLSVQPPQAWTSEEVRRAAERLARSAERMAPPCAPPCAPRSALRAPLEDLLERDRQAVWHPYTSLRDADPPLTCVGAQDEFLFLDDGRKVIDGISSWWTILHGHRHPVLMNALHEAALRFDHVHFAGVTHAPAVELAELLLSGAPWQGGRVFYSDNGSTAVEVALKMAYQYWHHQGETQRTRFIGFEGGYHGDTFGAMAVSRDPVFFGRFEPLLCQADIVPLSAERLDGTLKQHAGRVAAVILEPLVQGAGGMRMHSPQLLRDLFEVAKRHGVLFIADEIMTGGGRTGPLWAHQSAAIAPDLICAAKTLAGGVLPLAATLAAPHIVRAWETDDSRRTFFHGHSFTAHPLACAVGVANWKLLKSAGSPATQFEAFWRDALEPLCRRPHVRDVRVCGTIAAVELNVAGGYLADIGRPLRRRCLEDNVLLRPLGAVLYALPPFCTSLQSLEKTATAIRNAVKSL
jgi:adenosylmethionine---8-amino-7-oxononanoate aminotransferase